MQAVCRAHQRTHSTADNSCKEQEDRDCHAQPWACLSGHPLRLGMPERTASTETAGPLLRDTEGCDDSLSAVVGGREASLCQPMGARHAGAHSYLAPRVITAPVTGTTKLCLWPWSPSSPFSLCLPGPAIAPRCSLTGSQPWCPGSPSRPALGSLPPSSRSPPGLAWH